MGQYLDLAKAALTELKTGQQTTSAQEPIKHSESVLGYELNEINEKRGSCETLIPWDDPAVAAVRTEAKQLGVFGMRCPQRTEHVCRWLTGDALNRLPEELEGLVCSREGWTPESWAHYLIIKAGRCDPQHREIAELYTQAACLLWGIDEPSAEST